ncbi:hypothetical protein [Shewanella ulleungensis]|uniref:Porin n=1 Tax=Shewanella ulleungensis TaxID=2282699 RepID=A0ABQ2QSC2_9GAMM|nr:hypothetical protein [Shewanella ulleungensis]MCL1151673.1 hypothetical protein [Shewanella ulleungensis]GGP90336.1 hypothetical protein GCM10009410_25480 [Shewanella ulleungensis]
MTVIDRFVSRCICLSLVTVHLSVQSMEWGEIEHHVSGVVDTRIGYADSSDSYLSAGLGKFSANNGSQFALSQLGLSYHTQWGDAWSSRIVANGYLDGINNGIGLTEALVRYRDIPSESGIRLDVEFGLMYPKISLENVATAWASPYSLSYSTINSWLAEEVRHIGLSTTIESLGKYRQSAHDFSLTAEAFMFNDTTGAMLAWHGWTQTSRQTLLQETIPITAIPAMQPDGMLAEQAANSDPFTELDDRIGAHVVAKWAWRSNGNVQVGYYDNNANTLIVKQGQYVWLTKFGHVGAKWLLPYGVSFISQYMQGNTLMTNTDGLPVVDNDFHSGYIMLSKRFTQHRVSLRVEDFSVTDKDVTPDDNNNEDGQSLTVAYQYQLDKPWFIQLEYNVIDSTRPARRYINQPIELVEQQWQVSSRYFF